MKSNTLLIAESLERLESRSHNPHCIWNAMGFKHVSQMEDDELLDYGYRCSKAGDAGRVNAVMNEIERRLLVRRIQEVLT